MDPVLYEIEFLYRNNPEVESTIPAEFRTLDLTTHRQKQTLKSKVLLFIADQLIKAGTSIKRTAQLNTAEIHF